MADSTLWPWECHSISALGLFTLGRKDGRVFRGPMAVSAQNPKAPVRAPPCPGPDSGGGALGGPTWLRASEQAWLGPAATSAPGRRCERISPGCAYLHGGHARLRRTWASRTVMPYPIGAQRQKEALSPQRPGQAICRLPSPTLAPLSGPDRPGHPRPEPKPAAGAGLFAPRSYLVQRPGKPWAPRPQSSGPGSPGAGSSGKREGRTRLWRLQRRSRGSGGTCWLGGRSAQPELVPGPCRKRPGGSPLRHAGLGRRGAGVWGVIMTS